MAQPNKKHYSDLDGLKALSYNGIITEIISNRNYGKTWTFKKRAFKRAIKHGKKTIWLRMFKKEVKEALNTFYKSKDLCNFCGVSLYDKDTNKDGNLKQIGNTFYYRKRIKNKWSSWQWFLKVFSLSDNDAVRSADDVDTDTIIFDEATKTADKLKRYRGNIVNDFIDILFSTKREHKVRCFIIGNKESVNNPFNVYFGIKPLPSTFEGIRTYRNGAFVIQQINNVDEAQNEYDAKLKALLHGTQYGNYIYRSEYKNNNGLKTRRTPKEASIYTQLYFNNCAFKISVLNGFFYVNDKIDNSRRVFCDVMTNKYNKELRLVKRQKNLFIALINAIADNRVYYETVAVMESIQAFYMWLGV